MEKINIDDKKVSTRLLEKNYSPLIVRRYNVKNWPLFIGIICDVDLSDLDNVVLDIIEEANDLLINNIQSLRDFCGYISEKITEHYNEIKRGSMEGNGVILYADKLFISSLSADFMVHGNVKLEFFQILNIMTKI